MIHPEDTGRSNTVVLVQPPIRDFYITQKRTIPYGLASIAGGALAQGFQVKILDGLATSKSKIKDWPASFSYLAPFYDKKDLSAFSLFHEFKHFGYSHEHLAAQVREARPFLVGISSLFTAYEDQARETARWIKRFYPACKIVMGGHHPTLFPEKVLKDPSVDFVIRGEAEHSMALLCNALKQNSQFDEIPGICFKTNNHLHISEPVWLDTLNDLPQPAIQLIDNTYYQRNKRETISIVSSRGCPLQCSYCSVAATSSHGPYRKRNIDDILDEIKQQLAVQDVGFIDFEDENLCLDKSWFTDLFNRLIPLVEGKNIELRAMNGLYPPTLDEAVIRLLKKAGFKALNLALATTCSEQLKRFKRKDVRSDFQRILALAEKHGLECVSYLIGAAPGQSARSSLEDLVYLAAQQTLIGFSIFYPAPGSLDYASCSQMGLLPENFIQMRSTALPIEDTTTRIQAVTLLRLSRIINFMKDMIDKGLPLPSALPCPVPAERKGVDFDVNDRFSLSVRLLQWFFNDGKIRGVETDGRIYEHRIDLTLTRKFIDQLSKIQVRGVRS